MVRGHAKQVAQEKANKKKQDLLKAQKKGGGDDKKTKRAITCKICFASMIGEKALREHFTSKHEGKEFKPADYGL